MQTHSNIDPWSIDPDQFPAEGTSEEKLGFALRYAILAPSSHNTQPWRFRVYGNAVDLFADPSRRLPEVDPADRELIISCGAALFHLRTAIHYFGYNHPVELFPDPGNPALLATVRLGPKLDDVQTEEILLFHAITKRRTNRLPFTHEPIPAGLIAALEKEARAEGAWLHAVAFEDERYALADLVAEADRLQWANASFRRELADWLISNKSARSDGIPGYAEGMGNWASLAGPLVVRTFDLGGGRAAKDRELALHSPLLAVLGAAGDTPGDWLMSGQALARILLRARVEDVWASFLNQAIEIPDIRDQLAFIIGNPGPPQILLRLGFGQEIPPTPRRALAEVMHYDRHGAIRITTPSTQPLA